MKTPLLDVSTQKLVDEETGKDLEMDLDSGIASITKGGVEYKINFRNRDTPCVPGFEIPAVQVVDKKQKAKHSEAAKTEETKTEETKTEEPKKDTKKETKKETPRAKPQ